MNNKYGLGSSKVASEHHEVHHKTTPLHPAECVHCSSTDLIYSPTMHDHRCNNCGEWQNDVPQGYSTGRASNF